MLGSYVCRQCRLRLTRPVAPVRKVQWQPRATFLSLRDQKPQDDSHPAQGEAQLQQQPGTDTGEQQDRPKIRYTQFGEEAPPQAPAGRYSQLTREEAGAGFQPFPTQQAGQRRYEDEVEGTRTTDALERGYGPATAIDDALNRKNVDLAWSLFEKNFTSRECEALMDPAPNDISLLYEGTIFAKLLATINNAFCAGRKLAVTPTMALFRYEHLGLARPDYWARWTLVALTHQAILAVNATPEAPKGDLPTILFELLSVWRLFFQCKGPRGMPLDTIAHEWNLPSIDALPNQFESRDFNRRLGLFHPGYVGNPTLGFCAVYLYTLSDAITAIEPLHAEASPFIAFLGRILASSGIDPVFIHLENSRFIDGLPEDVKGEIRNEIAEAPNRASRELGASGVTLGADETGDPQANLEASHLKAIERAIINKSSIVQLDNRWRVAQIDYTTKDKVSIPPRIYNAFLRGYMTLLRPPKAVEIWNHMITNGVKPDIQSWVALLEGCRNAKDLEGFKAMWSRMLGTGVEPDNYAWTTRVNGFFALRQVNLGLAALDDMGKRWLAAETAANPPAESPHKKGAKKRPPTTKKVNTCTKPSIEVINGAITAIVQLSTMPQKKRIDLIHKILAWAANFSIAPDAYTYNTLIQLYLRGGDFSTAFKVLMTMENSGIAADIATHTMLITAAFNNSTYDSLSPDAQAEKMIKTLDTLESSGLKLTNPVYGTIIDRLLQQYSNVTAVRAVISHMGARNIVLSAHAYTSLVTFYFQQDPPLIAAVDALVTQFFTSNRVPTDAYLFDRVLEGYARHGEVGKMMSVLTRMSAHRRVPSWNALTSVVQALTRAGDFERARDVVRDVRQGLGAAAGYVPGGRDAEMGFERVIRSAGLDREMSTEQSVEEQNPERWEDGSVSTERLEDESVGYSSSPRPQHTPNTEPANPPIQFDFPTTSTNNIPPQSSEPPSPDEEDVHGFLTNEPETTYATHADKH
jgi:pentatricopeptide repeat protein